MNLSPKEKLRDAVLFLESGRPGEPPTVSNGVPVRVRVSIRIECKFRLLVLRSSSTPRRVFGWIERGFSTRIDPHCAKINRSINEERVSMVVRACSPRGQLFAGTIRDTVWQPIRRFCISPGPLRFRDRSNVTFRAASARRYEDEVQERRLQL